MFCKNILNIATPTLTLSITLISHVTQKEHRTKDYKWKYPGNKEAFLNGKSEMLKEYIWAQDTIWYLCNTIYCMQLSQLNGPEGIWNKKIPLNKRQPWKLCSILKSPCEAHKRGESFQYVFGAPESPVSADLVVLLKNRENTWRHNNL